MIYSDLHMHTTFCDGKNSAEEMVVSAIEKGLKTVGVCTHSYTDIDLSYCIKQEDIKVFQAEMARLKEKYKDKIKVLCGVEQDYLSNEPLTGFDYSIGSVHYFLHNGKRADVDNSPKKFVEAVENIFDGDYYSACENYFSFVGKIIEKTNADIIGHFDLVSKFNEGCVLFDDQHPRYIKAWQSAVDALIPYGKPFEINFGGISRGYKKTPYPSIQMIEYIRDKGGKFCFSSDSHNKDNVAFGYKEWKDKIEAIINKGENE